MRTAAALASLLYAVLLAYEESGRGFPDGHLTELDRALRLPRLGTAVLALGIGAWLLRSRGRWPLPVLVALVLFERLALPALGAWLGLDHGQGG